MASARFSCKKEKKKGHRSFCTSLDIYITDIKYTEQTMRKKVVTRLTDYRTNNAPRLQLIPLFHQSATSWRSSARPLSWRDELLWERLWDGLSPGMKGGDCIACKSGDLEAGVLPGCSGYVPLQDAARDFENELLPLPEGVMMFSMLECRWKLDCTCIGGGGDA
jgi:hypothetical protein